MKLQFRGNLLACATLLALGACATTQPTTGSAPAGAPAKVAAAPDNSPKAFGNYVRVVRNGQTLYCQKDSDTATRMVQETCITQAQAEAQQENTRAFMQGVQGIATQVSSPNAH